MRTYPEYKASGVEWLGDIPKDWCRYRIKFCFNSINGGVWGEEPLYDKNDIVCIRVADFNYEQGLIDVNNLTVRNISTSEQKSRLLKKGDLLIEKSGGGELSPVGRVVKFDLDIRAVCSNFINRLNTKKQFIADYLNYLNRFLYLKGVTKSCINQTTGIQNLKVGEFVSNTIFIPNSTEQQAIVNFLDYKTRLIDNFIANRQQQQKLLKEQKAGIINKAVTKGINPHANMKPSGIEWIGEIPEDWQVMKLKYLCQHISISAFSKEHDETYIALENIESWTGKLIFNEAFSGFDSTARKFTENDVLFGKLRPYLAKVAMPSFKGICVSEIIVLRPVKLLREFLYSVLLNADFIDFVSQTAEGTKMPRTSWNKICDLKFPLPLKEEQQTILNHIKTETALIDTLITKYQKQIELMQEYRTALISQAVTGKIDVRHWQPKTGIQT